MQKSPVIQTLRGVSCHFFQLGSSAGEVRASVGGALWFVQLFVPCVLFLFFLSCILFSDLRNVCEWVSFRLEGGDISHVCCPLVNG